MNTAAATAGEAMVTQRNATITHRKRPMKPHGSKATQARGVQPQGSAEDAAGAGDQNPSPRHLGLCSHDRLEGDEGHYRTGVKPGDVKEMFKKTTKKTVI